MNGSAGAISSQKRKAVNSTPNGQGEGITVSNLQMYWRQGAANTFNINVPVGYGYIYQIIEHESVLTGDPLQWNVVKMGNGITSGSVTHTFANLNDNMTMYDIRIVITKGNLVFERFLTGKQAITCLPAMFTRATADAIWNFTTNGVTYRDNNFTNRTNYRVWCEGDYNGAGFMGLEEWVSTNIHQPVHIMADPAAQVTLTTTNAFLWRINRDCQNILIDGCANPNQKYGFKFTFTGGVSHAQMMVLETSTNDTSTPATAGKNIWVCGVDFVNEINGSAFVKCDTANSAAVNYDVYLNTGTGALTGLHLSTLRFTGGHDEGLYCGYVDDLTHNGFAHAPIVGARIYDLIADSTGGDGLQMGASLFNPEITGCQVINAGVRMDANHKNMFQLSSGNRGVNFYRNIGFSGQNLFSIFSGRGGYDINIFSNQLRNPKADSLGHVNFFCVIYPNDYFQDLPWRIHNNTMDLRENHPIEMWNLTANPQTTKVNPFWYVDNAIVADQTQQMFTMNNPNQSGWTVANYQVTNSATPQFKNYAAQDYRPASLASPLFGPLTPFTKTHPLEDYDIDGYKMKLPIRGCNFGIELQT